MTLCPELWDGSSLMIHPWVIGNAARPQQTRHYQTITSPTTEDPRRTFAISALCTSAHWSICWSQSSPKGRFHLKQQEWNGAIQTVNFNQSPVLCVSPACLLFTVPLSFGWFCCSGSSYLCCVGVGAWSQQGVIGVKFLNCNHNFRPLDNKVLLTLNSLRSFIQLLIWVSDSLDEAEHMEKSSLTKDTQKKLEYVCKLELKH